MISEKRATPMPNVPTSKEAGFDNFVVDIWYGMLAPRGTPPAIVNRLNSEINKALAAPDLKDKLLNAGDAAARHHAGAVRDLHQKRGSAVREGDQGRRDQTAIKRAGAAFLLAFAILVADLPHGCDPEPALMLNRE